MSIFSKLLGKKTSRVDPANDPNLIRVFDKYGQELFITRNEWRTNVLPGSIKSQWNQPDELYGILVNALNDGFYPEVLPGAAQLYSIDPDPLRGSCLYAIALRMNGQLDESEKVLRHHLEKHGENAVIFTHLAKVYAERDQKQKAEEILWRALEMDPNLENGFGWYLELQRERDGEEGWKKGLQRIAALPGSWRAQIWLARTALDANNLNEAMSFYRDSLLRAGPVVPGDLLMQMSGDLGNHGHLVELIEITEPHFVAQTHGLQTGNNLIKAHLDLGHLHEAKKIVDHLYSLKRPDWRETLSYWDTEIAKARVATSQPAANQSVELQILTINGPVWLDSSSPAVKLFQLDANGPKVSFLGGSADVPRAPEQAELQMPDVPGRLSRSLPLFLAEQIRFSCRAEVQTLIPWFPKNGFVLSAQPWTVETLTDFWRQPDGETTYLVVLHLISTSDPWRAEIRLFEVPSGNCLAALEGFFSPANPRDGLADIVKRLTKLLVEKVDIEPRLKSSTYQLPQADRLSDYLLRLEQLLAIRCARMDTAPPGFLHGEREILEGNLQLCLAYPGNVVTRILLAETLLAMNKVKPEVVEEFSDEVRWLQTEHPLNRPVQEMVNEMLGLWP